VNALGLAAFVVNVLTVMTVGQALGVYLDTDTFGIRDVKVDWKTGTIFMKGGWISNLNAGKTSFDLGHFGFVHQDSPSYYIDHETGHTLSLAAFGSVFHIVGFIDELATGYTGYAEQLAEGHDPNSIGRPKLPMWS
jgi:hypothetical protein